MINIKSLKSQLTLDDYESIFYELGIPITSKKQDYWQLKSGCHNIDVNDGDSNLIFYLDSQTFKCFSHGCLEGQDIFDLVLTRKELLGEEIKFLDAINFIIDCSHLTIDNVSHKVKNNKTFDTLQFIKRHINHAENSVSVDILDESVLNLFENIYHQSWIDDGISIETLDKFEIMWYNYRQQIIIPVRDEDGNLVGVRARNQLPNTPKYIPVQILNGIEYNFPSSAVLYGLYQNLDNIMSERKVILLESEKSVMQLDTMGYNIGVGMFGLNLSKYQLSLLTKLGIEEVIIGIDKDFIDIDSDEYNEYVKRVNKLIKRLKGYFKVSVMVDYNGLLDYKDSPTDKGKDIFDKLFNERINI